MNVFFKGLAHLGIFTDNYTETLHFYTQQLPFEVIKETVAVNESNTTGVFPMKYALVRLNDLYVEIMECSNHFNGNGVAGAWNHVGLSVTDLDQAIQYLKERGVPEERFGTITLDEVVNPAKPYRQCRVKGYNGELIGLYELDSATFWAQ